MSDKRTKKNKKEHSTKTKKKTAEIKRLLR